MRNAPDTTDWTKINLSGAAVLVIVFGILAIVSGVIGIGILYDSESTVPRSHRTSAFIFFIIAALSAAIVFLTAFMHVCKHYSDGKERHIAMKRIWGGLGAIVLGAVILALSNLFPLHGGFYVIPSGIFLVGLAAIATTMNRPHGK